MIVIFYRVFILNRFHNRIIKYTLNVYINKYCVRDGAKNIVFSDQTVFDFDLLAHDRRVGCEHRVHKTIVIYYITYPVYAWNRQTNRTFVTNRYQSICSLFANRIQGDPAIKQFAYPAECFARKKYILEHF